VLAVADGHGDDTEGVVEATFDVVEGITGGTAIPGGGAATASGSSISSSGKSGNCSSKGEAGTPAKLFGTAGFADVPAAGNTSADEPNAVLPVSGEVARTPEVAPLDAPSSGINTKSFDAVLTLDAGAASAPTGPLADCFPADEVAPAATAMGLVVLFVPIVEASFAAVVDAEALREVEAPVVADTLEGGAAASLIGTPTGLEVPADVGLTPAAA
jgi:hypothetical protein